MACAARAERLSDATGTGVGEVRFAARIRHARRHPAPESDGSGARGGQSSEDRDMSYSPAIKLETAKKAAAAAMAEVRRNGWAIGKFVRDTAGGLVHFETMDGLPV